MRDITYIDKFREGLRNFHKSADVGIMGILNVTPDSFYDGGINFSVETAIASGLKMKRDGADIVDIGGASSRPGAQSVSASEEWSRVEPVLNGLLDSAPEMNISIDTYRAEVAHKAVKAGAVLINDISAGSLDPELLYAVGEANVPYVLMHMRGRPDNMQIDPRYGDVVSEVKAWFKMKISELSQAGVKDVILDPGFGFGKRQEDNYALLNNLCEFSELDLPVLVGTSRKSMIYNALDCQPSEALNGTTATHAWALERGASLLRVHDVREAREVVALHHHLCTVKSIEKEN
ncbi:MAG: dihydropteroate synthase [Bacteroidetes bacterium]|nr:dihydropteroate synthase [Bacteroidota bacterium]MDA0981288.1 dihydropteroate synthase [Bacteroidota bacterium]